VLAIGVTATIYLLPPSVPSPPEDSLFEQDPNKIAAANRENRDFVFMIEIL